MLEPYAITRTRGPMGPKASLRLATQLNVTHSGVAITSCSCDFGLRVAARGCGSLFLLPPLDARALLRRGARVVEAGSEERAEDAGGQGLHSQHREAELRQLQREDLRRTLPHAPHEDVHTHARQRLHRLGLEPRQPRGDQLGSLVLRLRHRLLVAAQPRLHRLGAVLDHKLAHVAIRVDPHKVGVHLVHDPPVDHELAQLEVIPCEVLHNDRAAGDRRSRADVEQCGCQLLLSSEDAHVRRLPGEAEFGNAAARLRALDAQAFGLAPLLAAAVAGRAHRREGIDTQLGGAGGRGTDGGAVDCHGRRDAERGDEAEARLPILCKQRAVELARMREARADASRFEDPDGVKVGGLIQHAGFVHLPVLVHHRPQEVAPSAMPPAHHGADRRRAEPGHVQAARHEDRDDLIVGPEGRVDGLVQERAHVR
mmetsp:Transcript_36924/g.109856  ORF Transcript_36924/g.109856 Transcript_36924/m.109856 type:complete len:426 (-) Transcript_36924:155-1432(-)